MLLLTLREPETALKSSPVSKT